MAPSPPAPTPEKKWHVRWCVKGLESLDVYPMWVGQATGAPSRAEQARTASGLIRLPSATLAFNPTARTLVNLDTWFWAQGLDADERRGTSAFGLVAIATPDRLEITAGDGSATQVCPWATVKSDRCAYTYQRSSVGGTARGQNGDPAYKASGSAIWKLRFEEDGAPITIPGAPTEVPGPKMETAVEVGEIQTIVTG